TRTLPPTVAQVNTRPAWRDHITAMIDIAPERVRAAIAGAFRSGRGAWALGAGHWLSPGSERHSRAGRSVAPSGAVPPAPGPPWLLEIAGYVRPRPRRLGQREARPARTAVTSKYPQGSYACQ